MIDSNIKVRIIDMNSFSIDKEVEFRISDEIFDELNKHVKYFEERGMEFNVTRIKIKEPTKFYEWIIERLYPEYYVEDHQKDREGIPDFMLKKISKKEYEQKCGNLNIEREELNHFKQQGDNWFLDKYYNLPEEIWIEVKKNGDGLHANQFKWILENKDKKIIKILFIKEDNPQGY